MSGGLSVGVALAVVSALAAFAAYRLWCRRRARAVTEWVTRYVHGRFGEPLDGLHVHCTDDPLWPVLANFDDPRTGVRHRLRFDCTGPGPACALLAESQEPR
jgi:hypothetical protein